MNMYDYLNYYEDYSFNEIPFNEVDALLLAMLAYLPNIKIKNNISIKKLNEKLKEINLDRFHGAMENDSKKLISIIYNSRRYSSLRIYNYVNITDDNVAFSAITFRNDYFTYVAYEGSNSSVVGWIENLMLGCKCPTKTQELAINYLANTITFKDKNIYVGGHSKGGNLAMVSTMYIKSSIFNRIKKVFNFDGPGFKDDEYNNEKFKKMNAKCLNFLPVQSLVGIIFNNTNYNYVEANLTGINQHFPINWQLFGGFIKKADGLSKKSLTVHNKLNKVFSNANDGDVSKLLDFTKEFCKRNKIVYFADIKEMNLKKFLELIKDYESIDKKVRKNFTDMIKMFFSSKN